MTINVFLSLLFSFSAIVSVVVEVLKTKFFKNTSSDLLALITSLVVGWGGGACAYIFLTIPFNPTTIVTLILLGPTLFFSATVGYDKVAQLIKQITQNKGSS